MLRIELINSNYKYEVAEFLRLFTNDFEFVDGDLSRMTPSNKTEDNRQSVSDESYIVNQLDVVEQGQVVEIRVTTKVYELDRLVYSKTLNDSINKSEKKFAGKQKKIDNRIKTISKRLIQRSMFDYLNSKHDTNVPWGILTGIRPVKLIHSQLDEGMGESTIRNIMKEEYLISDEKLDLIMSI